MVNKKIPKVFANKINRKAGNNENVYYSDHDNIETSHEDIKDEIKFDKNINQKINDIFNSPTYIYKADVEITLKNGVVSKRIVGKNNTHLITMENELIPISDIRDIKMKKAA